MNAHKAGKRAQKKRKLFRVQKGAGLIERQVRLVWQYVSLGDHAEPPPMVTSHCAFDVCGGRELGKAMSPHA